MDGMKKSEDIHRIITVGLRRDLWRSSTPTPLQSSLISDLQFISLMEVFLCWREKEMWLPGLWLPLREEAVGEEVAVSRDQE